MRTPARSSRVNNALQVFQHMNSGMTVSDTCREVGIPRSTFYDIVEKNPEAIAEVQDIIDANKREQLVMVLLAQNEILRKIIEDGLSDNIKPKERVAIFQKLEELKNSLMQSQHIDDENERRAHEFLSKGPTTRHVESRFSATETTVTYESESKYKDILG